MAGVPNVTAAAAPPGVPGTAPGTSAVAAGLALADAVAEWCVRQAEAARRAGRRADAVEWGFLAAHTRADFGSATLADEALERTLRACTRSAIPVREPVSSTPVRDVPANRALRWLHVFSITYRTGGHTAIARRWIQFDPSPDRHDLVVTSQQQAEVAPEIAGAFTARGGTVTALLPDSPSFADRADRIREMAASYDAVVVHVHMWDPTPPVAFGVPGGPPVFVVNHADHAFWLGSSIADRVLTVVPMGESLCVPNRGVDRLLRLPVPLPLPSDDGRAAAGRARREALGIPADAVVFVTVGSPHKYSPLPGISFFDAVAEILTRLPSAHLVAVGPGPESTEWSGVRTQFAPRLHTVGLQPAVSSYLAAADVYLEGFPCGSATALLEGVLAGLPPVLAPAVLPRLFRSDDFALASLSAPRDIPSYAERAIALGNDPGGCAELGADLARRVREAHCQPGWDALLGEVRALVGGGLRHDVYDMTPICPVDDDTARFWSALIRAGKQNDAFNQALTSALTAGLRPRVDYPLARALSRARRAGLRVSRPVRATVRSHVAALLPFRQAVRLYGHRRDTAVHFP